MKAQLSNRLPRPSARRVHGATRVRFSGRWCGHVDLATLRTIRRGYCPWPFGDAVSGLPTDSPLGGGTAVDCRQLESSSMRAANRLGVIPNSTRRSAALGPPYGAQRRANSSSSRSNLFIENSSSERPAHVARACVTAAHGRCRQRDSDASPATDRRFGSSVPPYRLRVRFGDESPEDRGDGATSRSSACSRTVQPLIATPSSERCVVRGPKNTTRREKTM